MKTHARVRRATSKTPGSVVKARVFFPTPRSAHFVIYVVDKGICGFFWVEANFLEAKSKLARQLGTWLPTAKLAHQVGARQVRFWRAPSPVYGARQLPHSSCSFAPRAPYTLHAFPLPSRHLTTLFF